MTTVAGPELTEALKALRESIDTLPSPGDEAQKQALEGLEELMQNLTKLAGTVEAIGTKITDE